MFSSLWMLVALAMGGFLARGAFRQAETASWTRVTGEVLTAEIEGNSKDGFFVRRTYQWSDPQRAPSAGGKTYRGSRDAFFSTDGRRSYVQAERDLADFPVGGAISVYVNPRDPSDAVLRPGPAPGMWVFVPVFALVAVAPLGLVAALTFIERRKRSSPSESDPDAPSPPEVMVPVESGSSDLHRRQVASAILPRAANRPFFQRLTYHGFGWMRLLSTLTLAFFCLILGGVGGPILNAWMRTSDWQPLTAVRISAPVACCDSTKVIEGPFTYQWTWAGQTHKGNRIVLAGEVYSEHSTESESEDYLKRTTPVGSTFDIWFDPANPAEAVVLRGLDSFSLGFVLIGLLGCTCALSAVVGATARAVRPRNSDLLSGWLPVEQESETILCAPPGRSALGFALGWAAALWIIGAIAVFVLVMRGVLEPWYGLWLWFPPGAALARLIYPRRRDRLRSRPKTALRIDWANNKLWTAPRPMGMHRELALSSVCEIVVRRPLKDSGENSYGAEDMLCAAVSPDPDAKPVPLTFRLASLAEARDIGEWLAARLGVPLRVLDRDIPKWMKT